MRIETERLILRPLGLGDLEDFLELHRQPEVVEFLGPAAPEPARERLELCERTWAERGHDLIAMVERSSGRFVGRTGLKYWPQFNETEVGWVLHRAEVGQGYASEAARAVIDWGFNTFPLPYITAMIRPDNGRSLGVARRLGLTPIREDSVFEIPVIVHATSREAWGAGQQPDEVGALLDHVARWASDRPDMVAVAVVGSRARGTARRDSDLDLVLLSRDPERYFREESWAQEIGGAQVRGSAHRGLLFEQRLTTASGLELDLGIGSPHWASVEPLDAGTARVAREALRVVYDPERLLARLREAVA
jgi:RimJ/RimL family protein N-acetyltransferase/predicted nucleotidyltransferase